MPVWFQIVFFVALFVFHSVSFVFILLLFFVFYSCAYVCHMFFFNKETVVQLLHVRVAVCRCQWYVTGRCTVLLEHNVVAIHFAYRWQQYDVIMTSRSSIEEVSKKYHQTFLLRNNNEITACIADLFSSFCEEVYAVAFLKVVQQQTTGKVGNSMIVFVSR